jgi:hypothetical protein
MILNFLFETLRGRYHLGNEEMAGKLIYVIFEEVGCEDKDRLEFLEKP